MNATILLRIAYDDKNIRLFEIESFVSECWNRIDDTVRFMNDQSISRITYIKSASS